MRHLAASAASPFLEMMQDAEGFHFRHVVFLELAEIVASVMVSGNGAMTVSVHVFIREKGAFAAFAGLYHILFVLWVIHFFTTFMYSGGT